MTARRPVAPGARGSEVDRLFRSLPVGYREIALALRERIRTVAPGLVERVKWNNPFWCGTGDVLCLQCYPDHVNLGFLRGAELAAQYPMLEGTGRSMRHVRIGSMEDAGAAPLDPLLRAAVALDARTPTSARKPPDRRG